MVRGTKKRQNTARVRKRRRGQKGGDIVRSSIGKALPLFIQAVWRDDWFNA